MCGFVGEIAAPGSVDRTVLYRMNNQLTHRGPDESGIVLADDRSWGVGHRRLCVVDPVGGKQPMIDPERQLTLVYNGEIYDLDRLRRLLQDHGFVCRTKSDTEVLLGLYAVFGMKCFEHLRGEFAFAIIDGRQRRALLVRDRIGLKPLFYAKIGQRLVFGSEIKAIFAHPEAPREFDPVGLTAALAVADTPGRTCFAGIQQVRHAHALVVDLTTLQTEEQPYWDLHRHRRRDIPKAFDEQVELVRDEVETAVRMRLRADVPVGAYLSGGLDSSIVTGLAARQVDSIDAFGLAFEDSPRHNEFHYAEQVASHLSNVRLHRISLRHEDMVRKLPQTVWHLERPFGNLHSVAKLIQAQYARQHVACVLTGDGGDEAFCGYPTYWLQHALQAANYDHRQVATAIKRMRQEADQIGGNRYYLQGGLATGIAPATDRLVERLGFRPCDLATAQQLTQRVVKLLHPDFRAKITIDPVDRLVDQLSQVLPAPNGDSHATWLQYVQLNATVPEYIAPLADRTEWAGSVEARPPLFDHRLLELAVALPIESKLHGDREKHVLREAFANDLPLTVIERRKQAFLAPPSPFATPVGRMLVETHLSPAAIRRVGVFHPARIRLLNAFRRFRPNSRLANQITTVVLTTQLLHDQLIQQTPL